jgi:hypothetical protein
MNPVHTLLPSSLRSILISSYLGLGFLNGLFPFYFRTKIPYQLLFSPMCATCPTYLTLLDFIIPKNYFTRSTDCEAPRCAVLSCLPLFNPSLVQIFSPTTCSQVLCLYFSLTTRAQVSHTHTKNYGVIIILYILISTFLDSKREHRVS